MFRTARKNENKFPVFLDRFVEPRTIHFPKKEIQIDSDSQNYIHDLTILLRAFVRSGGFQSNKNVPHPFKINDFNKEQRLVPFVAYSLYLIECLHQKGITNDVIRSRIIGNDSEHYGNEGFNGDSNENINCFNYLVRNTDAIVSNLNVNHITHSSIQQFVKVNNQDKDDNAKINFKIVTSDMNNAVATYIEKMKLQVLHAKVHKILNDYMNSGRKTMLLSWLGEYGPKAKHYDYAATLKKSIQDEMAGEGSDAGKYQKIISMLNDAVNYLQGQNSERLLGKLKELTPSSQKKATTGVPQRKRNS